MNPSPETHFNLMQSAVEKVESSPHPTNKIAATLQANGHTISCTNLWPQPIARTLGHDVRIGNSSGTVHAETACILKSSKTAGANLYVTDPPCPNCVKYMVEAGISALYIDHKGFQKDFAARRGDAFHGLSVALCAAGGIAVFKVFRKDQRLEVLLAPGVAFYSPKAILEKIPNEDPQKAFKEFISKQIVFNDGAPFAAAFTQDDRNSLAVLSAGAADLLERAPHRPPPDEKYNSVLQPVNRLLMSARREGLTIIADHVYSSRVPTARELVNIVGAGINHLWIGDIKDSRDDNGQKALAQLQEAGVLKTTLLKS